VGGVALALVVGNAVFSAWAEITVKSAWYSSLGIEAVYDTRWQLSLVLSAIGVVSVPLVLAPVIWASFRLRRLLPVISRSALVGVWVGLLLLAGLIAARSAAGMRDSWLAYSNASQLRRRRSHLPP